MENLGFQKDSSNTKQAVNDVRKDNDQELNAVTVNVNDDTVTCIEEKVITDDKLKEKARRHEKVNETDIENGDIHRIHTRKKGEENDEVNTKIISVAKDHTFNSQKDLENNFDVFKRPSPSLNQIVSKKVSKCTCSSGCLKRFVISVFPFINIMRNYKIKEDITGDIIAGLTVGIMHIPQGMAYAMLATLSPVYGLYTSFFPVLVYFFFGSSKHISLGTASVPCLMVGTAVSKGIESLSITSSTLDSLSITSTSLDPLFFENSTQGGIMNSTNKNTEAPNVPAADDISEMSQEELDLRLQFAMSVTFVIGVIQTYRDFFTNIATTNYVTVLMSVSSIAVLYCTSRFINQNPKLKPKMFMPVPIELIVVIIGTVISYFLNLEQNQGVAVVSDIPTGLPVPNAHGVSRLSWMMIIDAIPIVVVIFSISISIAKLLAKKHNYEVDANQELLAFGMSSITCSFMSSVVPMAALSRAVVLDRVGGKTQVSGLVSCCLLLVVLLAIGPYFKTTPKCVLAAVIVVSLRSLFLQILNLKNIYHVSKTEFFVWIVAFVSTVLLDVDLGLGVAVAFNLLSVIYRAQRPYCCMMGQLPGTHVYKDVTVYPEAKEIPGIKILRYEQSVFFLNKEHFRSSLYKRTVNPSTAKNAHGKLERKQNEVREKEEVNMSSKTKSKASADIELEITNADSQQNLCPIVSFHTLILDCSQWSFMDSMGVNVLATVILEYKAIGINVLLANCKDGVIEMFSKTKFYNTLDRSNIFNSLHDAVFHAGCHQSSNNIVTKM